MSKENVPGAVNGTTSHYIDVRGETYHYLHAYPAANTTSKGTILLFHGLPDFSYGWHHQIPFLASLGYRVLAPDMLGAVRTSAPCPIARYTFKEMSADIASIVDQVLGPDAQVIVGGHDWGTGVAYKFPMWYPEKTKAMFALSYPYMQTYFGPNTEWVDLEELVKDGRYPTYGYQLQWRDISFDRNFTTKDEIRTLLTANLGASTKDGRYAFSAETGTLYDVLPEIDLESSLLKGSELDIYVDAISKHGVRGGYNWYRTRRMNYEDELEIAKAGGFRYKLPALFIPSLQDPVVLPRYYEEEMKASFDDLTIDALDAGHFLMIEDPQGVNRNLEKWLGGL